MRVVSFFAGCGGLDLGFEQAGFQVVWANEFDTTVRDTYLKNHPNTKFVLADINAISSEAIPDCDGFIGGPPCQSWSVAGKRRGLNDERGKLFLTYIGLIEAKRPKFFVIENVKGILDDQFKDVFEDFIFRLDSAGYDVKWELLDAVNYRVPQNRERVFIIGFRKDLHICYEFPMSTCHEPITLNKALGDIQEKPTRYGDKDSVKSNTLRPNHDVLTSEFGPFYYRGNRRRGWNQPSFTIHATADNIPLHPSSPKMMFFGHENWNFQQDKINEYRRLSVRECARIQTFPDSFIFDCDNIKAAYKMIGNAVPPRMACVLARSIDAAMENVQEVKREVHFSNRLDSSVLVGYYKNEEQYNYVLKNRLYYVRSDGRKGSIFKQDCAMTPRYLLLYHGDKAEIYELDAEEPVLASGAFLRTLGFDSAGEMYLCFNLKDSKGCTIEELGGNMGHPNYDKNNYAPYFTTLEKIICKTN
jgi:DNA (cytosine-5)-methyltransferase 1